MHLKSHLSLRGKFVGLAVLRLSQALMSLGYYWQEWGQFIENKYNQQYNL